MQVLRIRQPLSPTPILHIECCIRCPTRRGQELPELLEGQGSLAARLPLEPAVHSLCFCLFPGLLGRIHPSDRTAEHGSQSPAASQCVSCHSRKLGPSSQYLPLPTSVSVWGFLVYHLLGSELSGTADAASLESGLAGLSVSASNIQ